MKKEINPYKRGSLANSMAFHDFCTKEINIVNFSNYIVELFKEYSLEPTRMGITLPSNQTRSMKTYIRERKKLESIPESEIQGFTLQATSYNSDNSSGDGLCTVIFSNRNFKTCTLVFDSQFLDFDVQKMKKIYKDIIKFLSPNYGYSYQREFKKGPEFYPYGIISGLPFFNCPERDLIDAWGQKLMPDHSQAYKTSDLRDVYPMNLLVDKHLTRVIFLNTSFERLIDSDKRYGTLEKISDEHYIWTVDEENISFVRETLRPSGMIIAG